MIGIDYFRKFYSPERALTIFDVGAHRGDSVSEFLSLFPKSRVFAFEPDKDNFSRLSKRFSGEHRVQTINAAVGEADGRALLHCNNYDATHSLLPFNLQEINRWADASDFREVSVTEVDQLTLDSLCVRQQIAHIDILKLDTQGAELMAFKGAAGKLSAHDIACIFCEVEFRTLYKDQPLFWDISAHLMSHGYHFVNLVSPKESELGVLSWADAIYVNHSLWQQIAEKHSAGKFVS